MRARSPRHLLIRLRGEDGFTLILAVTILFIGMLLTGAAVMAASQTNESAQGDSNRKNALEAAEAGLNAAVYRLNELDLGNSSCATDSSSVTVTDANAQPWCQSKTYSLGNNASYQYWVTPTISPGTCVGLTVTNANAVVNQRCITSVGVANGVAERSQIRVAGYAATSTLYGYAVLGYNGITLSGTAKIAGTGATNKTLSASGSASIGSCEVGPSGGYNPPGGTFCTGGKTTESSAFVPSSVSPQSSNNFTSDACPSRYSATSNPYGFCNDDFRITNGATRTAPYDAYTGNVTYNTSKRSLNLSGNASLTLSGSLYNFCSITLSGGSAISISGTQKVTIIVDNGTADGCPGTGGGNGGNFDLSGGSVTNTAADPTYFQIDVVGVGNVDLSGGSGSYGEVLAPQSPITLSGSAAWYGSVTGDTVKMSGGSFNYSPGGGTVSPTSSGTFFRTAWGQCTATYASSNPGANCG